MNKFQDAYIKTITSMVLFCCLVSLTYCTPTNYERDTRSFRGSDTQGITSRSKSKVMQHLAQIESVERYYQQLFLRGYLSEDAVVTLDNIQRYIRELRNYLETLN
ncbi:hypothetical protein DPMN_015970 [Dreissena polymorpha]|uniref:Uncharacterized protein n=1 Tax=Dreissena polymorpha TaxID=45954 RepID=A0A9D4NA74_DREPO|nr:hypothetical protein DPMN_015970 [Dreissena polymorpha]